MSWDLCAKRWRFAAIRYAREVMCLAIVHPINSAGFFDGDDDDRDAPFVINGSYLRATRYTDDPASR
ncbi:MAG: hypothetical protein M5U31_01605 [Acidimicrobiia bacterium]|nr:hypothetical protein [Acidimicrobiia bacterium]